MSLGTQVLIGVLAGIAVGVVLGEWSGPFQVLGDVYVGLLQMTVLPYVVVSLISRIGSFTHERALRVARHGSVIMLALWAVALGLVVLLPLSLPAWDAGTFFSASLVEEAAEFGFLDLYIPTNPFRALADNVVPAAVVFSILVGVALIPIDAKGRLLDPLEVVGDALGNVTHGVVRLSPWGTFALAAGAAGTASVGELARLSGYLSAYTLGVLLLTFGVLPAIVASLSPVGYGHLLSRTRATLLTAFATGKLFAVLGMIIDDVRSLLAQNGVPEEEAADAADVLVPLGYPFPNAGRILALLFIPFAGWFIGQPLGVADLPVLVSVGLLSFFGSPVVAIPFLLGLFRLPADLLALFLVAGIWGARFGDLLGVMHLMAFSLLTAFKERGQLRVGAGTLPRAAGMAAAVAVTLWVNHAIVSWTVAGAPPPSDRVAAMQSMFPDNAAFSESDAGPNPDPILPAETRLARIRRTRALRVGYVPDRPPFGYRNRDGELVGLGIDLAHRLAVELDAQPVLVPYARPALGRGFSEDHFDVAVGAIASSVQAPDGYRETEPFLDLNAALIVPDHRVREFATLERIQAMPTVKVGYVEGGVLVRTGRHRLPGVELVPLSSAEDYLTGETPGLDALVSTAETGAVHTMIYPVYSVVVPEGFRTRVPVVLAVAADSELEQAVNRFLRIKRTDGTVEALYDHWILGRSPTAASRRWSVVHDVFGWSR